MATSGSETLSAVDRRNRYVAKGVSVQNPIIIAKAEGAVMWDEAGNEFLDFAGGIGCLNVGSTHPEVVAAIKAQADMFLHTCFHVTMNEPYLQLAEKLCKIVPIQGELKAFLANSGAEAVENAIKMARSFTGRMAVVTFDSAFHGRTNLALALTSKVHPYKAGFGPFAPEVYRLPFANPYRCAFSECNQSCKGKCVDQLVKAFDMYVDANQVAAVIVEPVQGEGGFIVPPPDYLPAIREICHQRGILFIADEVQTGFGRTGKMFACEHYAGLNPDLIVMSKSMGAGLPISAVVGRSEILDSTEVGGLGGTFGGNPLSAAAALKVIEIIERDGLAERANQIGATCMDTFERLQKKFSMIGDVRGQGAMVAMEFVKDATTKTPYSEAVAKISEKCLKNGVITIKAGVYNNVIRLLTPLVISDEQLQRGLDVIARAIEDTAAELNAE